MLTKTNITEVFHTYYRTLYKGEDELHKKEKIESFFNLINPTRLTADEVDMITSFIKEEEIKENILKLKKRKSQRKPTML